MKKIVALIGMALSLTAAPALAQTLSVNTIPSWNGVNAIGPYGVPNTATYGQTITVAAGSGPLTQFQFEIGTCTTNGVTVRGQIFAWNVDRVTGPSLFKSAPVAVPVGPEYTLVTFNTGGVTLPAGTYVLMVSNSEDQAVGASSCRLGRVPGEPYPGGQFFSVSNGTDTTRWAGSAWSPLTEDLAFSMTFAAPVPTMDTWMMLALALGLSAMAVISLRRRSTATLPS